jgi:prophage maintenance system killer protein
VTWPPSLEDYVHVVAAVCGVEPDRARDVIDQRRAEAALRAPFAGVGRHARYPTLEEKVAVLAERLAHEGLIRDGGNERCAFVMTVLFAERNGRMWRPEDSDRDAAMIEALAAARAAHGQVLAWIHERTR